MSFAERTAQPCGSFAYIVLIIHYTVIAAYFATVSKGFKKIYTYSFGKEQVFSHIQRRMNMLK
nr:MAG TPA: hypothetical protein [Caudoviricetes sp.]